MGWNTGYRIIALLQAVLTAVLFCSLPLWKTRKAEPDPNGNRSKPLTLKQIFALKGAREVMLAFFCYCALEQTCILWGSSYLVMVNGLDEETAASLASLFMLGLTFGRFLSGFVTYKLNDTNMIRLGEAIIVAGIAVMLLPLGTAATMVGLALIGFGCAPIYPCIIHSTPDHFGEDNSQAIIGIQMASAYVGICCMPPLFGLIANHITPALLPGYLAAINVGMILMSEGLNQKTKH